jgi:hypothetical protein
MTYATIKRKRTRKVNTLRRFHQEFMLAKKWNDYCDHAEEEYCKKIDLNSLYWHLRQEELNK